MPEQEVKISPAVLIIPVGLGIAGILGLAAMAWAAPAEIALSTGWNEVTYTGRRQSPEQAFASILDFMGTAQGVWYWDEAEGEWLLVFAFMDGQWQSVEQAVMVPGGTYNVYVIMDCIWAF